MEASTKLRTKMTYTLFVCYGPEDERNSTQVFNTLEEAVHSPTVTDHFDTAPIMEYAKVEIEEWESLDPELGLPVYARELDSFTCALNYGDHVTTVDPAIEFINIFENEE